MVVGQQAKYFLLTLIPIAIIFYITMLTEIKKIPFDVAKSESKLGSRFLVEHSAINFALLIVGKYVYIILLITLFIILFLGSTLPLFVKSSYSSLYSFGLKFFIIMNIYLIIRSVLPNFRFDQVMTLH